jgi:CelD/BcsL family acetyltransferase involved in cellulose biosynthesis
VTTLLSVTTPSMRPVSRLSPVRLEPDDVRWLAFVCGRPDALPFHHPAWLETIARSYGYRPFAIALARPNGELAAGLPLLEVDTPLRRRRWVSLPFTDYCPPLASAEESVALMAAVEGGRTAAGVGRLDVRASVAGGVPAGKAFRHVLPLTSDVDGVFSTFSRSQVQRSINKSLRSHLILRRAQSRSELVDGYYNLHLRTRRRLGVPTQPRRFFDHLWTNVLEPGLGFLLLAVDGDRPVAGAVFMTGGKTIIYKYGASDPSSWGARPNHLIFSSAIRWSCEHGYRTFDFGRTDLRDEGLRAFKAGWGTTEEQLVYTSFGHGIRSPSAGSGLMSVARPVIRRSPPALSRLAGTLFYRYGA